MTGQQGPLGGKTAIVTGASRGIGKAAALARAGARAVLPKMLRRSGGHIINISSVVTQELRHEPFTGLAYDVSKAAMNRLTLGLAQELRPAGIAVNALMPGNTETEGWAFLNPAVDRAAWDRPEDWGRYVALLAACDPGKITGRLLSRGDLENVFKNQSP